MTAQTLQIDTADGAMQAYLATPAEGSGPGLVLLHEIFGINDFMRATAERYAEEGYVCVVPDLFWREAPGTDLPVTEAERGLLLRDQLDTERAVSDIGATIAVLRQHARQQGDIGVIGYCMGGLLSMMAACRLDVSSAVSYYPTGLEQYPDAMGEPRCPLLVHFGDADDKVPAAARERLSRQAADGAGTTVYSYPECDHAFANATRSTYNKPAAMMAYSRTLALLRRQIGPIFDLSTLWDRHTEYEFASRDVDATMRTMVQEPYVNHIPTMTGGVGHDHLKRFYKYHFVNSNPADTRLIPVSRTVGADRLVDEMIFCFTHTCEIPWMLPGIPPSGRYVEIPLVAIVNFRGDKLYHEHIYWDQASVLVQIGLLDADGLPVAGIATARKLLDEQLPSNQLMAAWADSEGQPL